MSEAEEVRWVSEPVMTQRRRAWVRHTRLGCIWGLGVWQWQRQRIFVCGAQMIHLTRIEDLVVRSNQKKRWEVQE